LPPTKARRSGPARRKAQVRQHRRPVRIGPIPVGKADRVEVQHGPPGGQAAGRQVEGQAAQALDPGLGGLAALGGVLGGAVGQPPFARAAVLGPLGLGAQQDLGLAALGGEPAAGGVAARLAFAGDLGLAGRLAHLALGRLQVVLGGGHGLGLALGIEVVAAAVAGRAQAGQLDDAVHAAQQRAVVADHHRPALPPPQHVGQQAAGGGVEIVGRLVQQDDVGGGDQQAGQGRAGHLAAAEAGGRIRGVPARQPDLAQGGGDAARQGPVGLDEVLFEGFGVPSSASMRHSRSQAGPTPSRSARRAPGGGACRWGRTPTTPARLTVPETGAAVPAISDSSVDLPTPLRPTRPMRSAPIVRFRLSKRTRPSGVSARTESRVMKAGMGNHGQGCGKGETVVHRNVHGCLHRSARDFEHGPSRRSTGVRQVLQPQGLGTRIRRKDRVSVSAVRRRDNGSTQQESPMSFTVSSLPIEPFAPLFALDDAALAQRGMLRVVADAPFAFPCRVTLDDAAPGETLILLNHEHQAADTPFRSRHAIYVREAAPAPTATTDALPPPCAAGCCRCAASTRPACCATPTSSRARRPQPVIERMLADPGVAYLHAHYAKPGCYAARIDRVA
jgi:hypothetical protein